jgi:hypothetical protein
MKKVILVLLMAVIAMPTFQSCKKYENGPSLSFRSKKARVANDWAISYYLEDNIDITAQRTGDDMTLTKDGDATYHKKNGDKTTTITGTWKFDDAKENITFIGTCTLYDLTNNPMIDSVIQDMKITKLKEKEMWWEGTITEKLPVGDIWPFTSSNVKKSTVAIKFESK